LGIIKAILNLFFSKSGFDPVWGGDGSSRATALGGGFIRPSRSRGGREVSAGGPEPLLFAVDPTQSDLIRLNPTFQYGIGNHAFTLKTILSGLLLNTYKRFPPP
jgi:hypothetical protein